MFTVIVRSTVIFDPVWPDRLLISSSPPVPPEVQVLAALVSAETIVDDELQLFVAALPLNVTESLVFCTLQLRPFGRVRIAQSKSVIRFLQLQ